MADKKLNAVDSATTVANFYGNNGGKDVQIPLATAASVLAGQMKIHQLNGNILANNTIVIKTRLVSTKYASDIFEISLITLSRTMNVLFGIVGYYGTTNSFAINSNINGNNNIEISAFQYDGYVYIAITNNNTNGYQYKIQSNNSIIEISDLTEIPTDVETKTITW